METKKYKKVHADELTAGDIAYPNDPEYCTSPLEFVKKEGGRFYFKQDPSGYYTGISDGGLLVFMVGAGWYVEEHTCCGGELTDNEKLTGRCKECKENL